MMLLSGKDLVRVMMVKAIITSWTSRLDTASKVPGEDAKVPIFVRIRNRNRFTGDGDQI